MFTTLLPAGRRQLLRLALGLAALLALFWPFEPVKAAAPSAEASPAIQELRQELSGLQSQAGIFTAQQARRLADLSRLETAIADANDRPTITNDTSHNLGVFVRSKRQSSGQPATFVVLGSGHETDDDYASIALFIPANVPVSWPGRSAETGGTPARVVPLLPGEELRLSQPEGAKGYHLNLPAFALLTESAELGALPSFSQEELDAQLETAPVD